MKKVLLLSLFITVFASAYSQWSNTTNQFYDSLDMPVARATYDQKNPLVIKSQPDGGYFVIWEDYRNALGNCDIYAQKFSPDGTMIWTNNGVPVATGAAPDQQYSTISNGTVSYTNYQSVSHAATDGNGGFYITWQAYIASPSSSYGVYIQHIRNDGTRVFADEGYGLALPSVSSQKYSQPQLIADGNGGFFIGYLRANSSFYGSVSEVNVYSYKDEAGTLKRNGGGIMSGVVNYWSNLNDYRFCPASAIGGYVTSPTATGGFTTANSFKIFDDGQGGCGVVMSLAASGERNFPAFNQLCLVKRDISVQTVDEGTINYKKDSLVTLYTPKLKYQQVDCTPPGAPPGSTVVNNYFTVQRNGAKNLLASRGNDAGEFDQLYPGSGKYNEAYLNYAIEKINAALLPTDGNVNALLVTWNQRNYVNSQATNWSTRSIVIAMEKYDALPYQLLELPRPAGMNKLNEGKTSIDTLIAPSKAGSAYDYSLTGSGNKAYLVSSINGLASSSGSSPFYYQEVKLLRQTADSFAVKRITTGDKDTGVVIGIATGNDRFPAFAGDGAGNATFHFVGPNGRDHVRASPVAEGGKLLWGALGLPLNSGGVGGAFYYPSAAFMYMDAGGKGVMAWNDGRRTPDGYTGENVYVRHLDSLVRPGYQPPALNTQLTVIPANPTAAGSRLAQSNPQSLLGSSNAWTTFQVPVAGPTSNVSTPIAAIRDDYNLGTVSVSTYDFYNQPLRRINGKPYLDRNYTISVTNHPPGAAIHVRLIFTKAQFDAMKAADPSIQDPGNLAVIKQPSTGTAPPSYTASANDQGIRPTGWGTFINTVDNVTSISGYYIEVVIDDFSNFFIMSAASVLPVTLQSFTVKTVDNTALLQWVTATELNNDHFEIERSADGRIFKSIGRVQGNGTTSITQDYRFTDLAPLTGSNYYRLAQVDLDGNVNYSPVRLLAFDGQAGTMRVSPNPVKSVLHVTLPKIASGADFLELYTLSGLKMLVQVVQAGALTADLDLSSLAPGVYVIRYGTTSLKVVKD